jgi:hypothetical protein
MVRNVANLFWKLLEQTGVKRCYGIVDPIPLSLPSHIPFHAAKGCTLSLAKQVLNGRLDTAIKMIEHNVRLV